MNRVLAVLVFLAAACHVAAAESAYELSAVTDSIVGAAAIGIAVPSFFVEGSAGTQKPLDEINGIDRALMYDYSTVLDDVSTVSAYAALLIPGVSVLGKTGDIGVLLTYGAMYAEAFLLTMGTKDLLKAAVSRHRPFTYLGPVPAEEQDDYFNSFPSGHTAFAFLGATFLTATLLEEYPRTVWTVPAISLSYALGAGIATVRILSGNHFVTDVVAGALIGSFYGWLVPRMHLRDSGTHLSISRLPEGMSVRISVAMAAARPPSARMVGLFDRLHGAW